MLIVYSNKSWNSDRNYFVSSMIIKAKCSYRAGQAMMRVGMTGQDSIWQDMTA